MSEHSSLFINKLDLPVHLGWTDNERLEKQTVQVNIEIFFSTTPKACTSDDLNDTHCYDHLIQTLFEKTKNTNYRLIEYLAQEIHQIIKVNFNKNDKVTIHITKHPVISGFSGNVRFSYGD